MLIKKINWRQKHTIAIALIGVLLVLGGFIFFRYTTTNSQLENKMPSLTVAPTSIPTLVPTTPPNTITPSNIKRTYTFYIQTSSHTNNHGELILTSSDSGKTFTVDIGTFILLYLGKGYFQISQSSPQNIFHYNGRPEPVNLPINATAGFSVFRKGSGTITAIKD